MEDLMKVFRFINSSQKFSTDRRVSRGLLYIEEAAYTWEIFWKSSRGILFMDEFLEIFSRSTIHARAYGGFSIYKNGF